MDKGQGTDPDPQGRAFDDGAKVRAQAPHLGQCIDAVTDCTRVVKVRIKCSVKAFRPAALTRCCAPGSAAAGLPPDLAHRAEVGTPGFAGDYLATNKREIAFDKRLQTNRQDARVHFAHFDPIEDAANVRERMVPYYLDLASPFVVWDTPALAACDRLASLAHGVAMATVDPGKVAAINLARGGAVRTIAVQQPCHQGIAAPQTVTPSLLPRPESPRIALPAIKVKRARKEVLLAVGLSI